MTSLTNKKIEYKIRIYKEPHKINEAKKYVCDALDTTWVCIAGKYIDGCTEKFKEILGVKYVVLTATGTAALHCCVKSLKRKHPEVSKIYVPNNVYISLWNMLLTEYKPGMIEALDADMDTWNVDTRLINTLEKNSAFFVVHNIGNIVNIPLLKRKRPDIIFIEDNAEGFMGTYEGKRSGSDCFASILSFNMNKTVTSGHGGAFCTNDKDVYEYVYDFVRNGSTRHQKYLYQFEGHTYAFTNLQAGVIYSQLEMIDEIMERKAYIFEYYRKRLKHPKLCSQKEETGTHHSYWYYCVRIIGNTSYNDFKDFMDMNGIETRPLFYPITSQPHLKDIVCKSDKNAVILNNECALLPCYTSMTYYDLETVCKTVLEYCDKI